ncbi:glycosyltransferase [Shewanella vesiculosa]|uniref:glycosyltransferase n=1 Tax=Shewanella vesiculosa TaxID=518738 RepID=UPI003CFC2D15
MAGKLMLRKNIVLVDPFSTGHHIDYATNVIKSAIKSNMSITLICNSNMSNALGDLVDKVIVVELNVQGRFLFRELSKIKYIKEIEKLINVENPKIVHFLYADRFYRALNLLCTKTSISYYATCHWFYMLSEFSESNISKILAMFERFCIRKLVSKQWRILTHSNEGSKRLLCDTSFVIDYPVEQPVFVENNIVEEFRKKLRVPSDAIILLCFGGTRFDKGADEAIHLLSKLKINYHLIIAGKEESLSFFYLNDLAKNKNCSNRLHLFQGYISDSDTNLLFNSCDIVLIPYKKTFSGQSGPLTIAGALGKFIIGSDVMIVKETINNYSLGYVVNDASVYLNSFYSREQFRVKNDVTQYFLRNHDSNLFIDKLSDLYKSSR